MASGIEAQESVLTLFCLAWDRFSLGLTCTSGVVRLRDFPKRCCSLCCTSGAELCSPGPSQPKTVTGFIWCESLSESKISGIVLLHRV